MQIIYSKYNQTEIEEKMKDLLIDVPGTFWETTKLSLIKLPFTILFLIYDYLIIKIKPLKDILYTLIVKDKLSEPVFIIFYGLFLFVLISFPYIYKNPADLIKKYMKTPCIQKNKENREKIELLNEINKLLNLQIEIKEFIKSDEANFVLFEDSDKLDIIVHRKDISIAKEFILTNNQTKSILENNILDFSYLDDLNI